MLETPLGIREGTPPGPHPQVSSIALRRAGYTILGWSITDIAATVRGLATRGVVFLHYDGMDQDSHGVWTAPSGAKVAWFADPDGNILSLTQFQ